MRKRFPSQIRYEEKTPLFSFRLKKVEKSKINLMADRSGKSVSELVRMALLDLERILRQLMKKYLIKRIAVGLI